MVCAPKQVELAMRPQNLPEIQRLFAPWSYFIDTTYAVGPRECSDPAHPIGRNDDIAWKIRLSDEARKRFGIFGDGDAAVTSALGGEVLLPPFGLVIEGPWFAAFYAKKWGGREHPGGALFTLQPAEGESLQTAGKLRIFHGFGDPEIMWKGAKYEVAREKVITPGG
jgi:hypothetical protein